MNVRPAKVLLLCFCLVGLLSFEALAEPPALTLQARQLRGLTGEVAGLLLKSEPGGNLGFEAVATTAGPAAVEGKKRLLFSLEIDGSTIVELGRELPSTRLEIYAYALQEAPASEEPGPQESRPQEPAPAKTAPAAKVVDHLSQVVAIDLARDGEAIWQYGLRFRGELALPPGTYRLRLLLRLADKGNALRELRFEVPGSGGEWSVPFLPFPLDRETFVEIRSWDPALLAGLEDDPLGLSRPAAAPSPFSIDERRYDPSALAVLRPRRVQTIWIFGRSQHLPPSIQRAKASLFRAGKVAGTAQADLGKAIDVGGFTLFPLQMTIPALDAGRYQLGFEFAGKKTPLVEVFILAPDAIEGELLWTDLDRAGAAPEIRTADATPSARTTEEAAPPSRRRKVQRWAERYRELISSLKNVSPEAARQRFVDFESQVLAEESKSAVGTLYAAEVAVAEVIAKIDAEALPALLYQHLDLYRYYRERRIYALVSHTRLVTERLARMYALAGKGEGPKRIAARTMTLLAGDLGQNSLQASGLRLNRGALELDPRARAAVMGLAFTFERNSQPEDVVEILMPVVEAEPDFYEGKLRLAINLLRLGQSQAQASKMLEDLVQSPAETWIRLLAGQELARQAMARDDLESAGAVLAALPGSDAGTLILRAHLEDKKGRSQKAFELLGAVAANGGESARQRYDRPPREELELARVEVREAARIRWSLLGDIFPPGVTLDELKGESE